jgi:hypothetical protein
MRKILTLATALSVSALAWAGGPATPPAKKSTATPAVVTKKPVTATSTVKKPAVMAKKPAVATAAAQKGKKAPVLVRSTTTWRNRQTTPSQDRYKQIQDALVAKGYLSSEEANGNWGQSSADALKNFQAEQTLESTGKINSLSLIALGLGPKHDSIGTLPVDGNYAQPESGKN